MIKGKVGGNMEQIEEVTKLEQFFSKIGKCKLLKILLPCSAELLSGTIPVYTMLGIAAGSLLSGIENKNTISGIKKWTIATLDEKFDEHDKDQEELIKHAFLKISKCSHDAQIQRIIDILSGTFDGKIDSYNSAEDLMNIVAELSENEAIVFNRIYGIYQEKEHPDFLNGELNHDIGGIIHASIKENIIVKSIPELSDELAYYLNRLIGKGLLREETINRFSGVGEKHYQYTLIGKRLYDIFQEDSVDN